MSVHLVVGGTGRTGRRVVDRLTGAGHWVRIVSRRPGRAGAAAVDSVVGDLGRTDEAGWASLLDGVDGVAVSVEPPYDAAGAEAVMHDGVARLSAAAAVHAVPVVLVSQIYITRPEAYPEMAEVTRARGRGEQALRSSGTPYAIVRPGWLTDDPPAGVRLEQGDTGDGRVSRDTVADAVVALLLRRDRTPVTFEVFDSDRDDPVRWSDLLTVLRPDQRP